MATNKNNLKNFARLDGLGRLIPGSAVYRKNKPKNGSWLEIPKAVCCDNLTICETTTTP